MALKEILGRDKTRASLGGSSLLAAGIIGFLTQLISIGISAQAARTARFPEVEIRIAFLAAHHLGNSLTAWLGLGFFLAAGIVFGAGQEMTTLPVFRTLFELLILVGGAILAPVWAIWLAVQLKPQAAQENAH